MSIHRAFWKYPLVLLILSSVFGIFTFGLASPWLKVLSVFFLCAIVFSSRTRLSLLVLVFFFVSGFRFMGKLKRGDPLSLRASTFHGRICRFPQRDVDGSVRFILLLKSGRKVLCFWRYPHFPIWGGEKVEVFGNLSPVEPMKNPGSFSYSKFLRLRGIGGFLWVKDLKVLARGEGPLVFLRKRLWEMATLIEDRVRRGVVLSLVLGERRMVPRKFMERVRALGLSHIFAISGLHLVLVFYLFYRIFFLIFSRFRTLLELGLSRKISEGISLVPTAFYAVISGFSVATKRALFGLFIYVLLSFSGKRKKVVHAVLGAMAVILLFYPWELYSAGFVLSFTAVFSIIFAVWLHKRVGLSSGLSLFVFVLLSPFIFTLPLQAYFFHYIPTYGILSNMVVVPVFAGFTMPLLMLSSLLFVITGSHMFSYLSGLSTFPLGLVNLLSKLPYLKLSVGKWDILLIISAVSTILLFWKRLRHFCVFIAAIFLFLWVYLSCASIHSTSVYFLDVKGGSSSVVVGRSCTAVIDTGPSASSGRAISSLIWWLGRRSVDALFITSSSRGSLGGIGVLLDRFSPLAVYYSKLPMDRDLLFFYAKHRNRFIKVTSPRVVHLSNLRVRLFPSSRGDLLVVLDALPRVFIFGSSSMRSFRGVLCDVPSLVQVPRGGALSSFSKTVFWNISPRLVVVQGKTCRIHRNVYRELKKLPFGMLTTADFGCIKVSLEGKRVLIGAVEP